MTTEELEALLLTHDIRPTANRILVARALMNAKQPLAMAELEEMLDTVDKSNISRTLALFRSSHLVHEIDGASQGVRYEMCRRHSDEHDDDAHVHFYCMKCQQTFCLDHEAIPQVHLPQGFKATTANFVLKGLCPKCNRE